MNRCTILLAALLSSWVCPAHTLEAENLGELNLPPVPPTPWAFKGFPIMAWWPPPGTASLEDFKNYKDAGFTIYCANPDAGFEQSLSLSKQVGLPVIAWRTQQGFSTPGPKQPVVFHIRDPNIVGWIVCDEPSGTDAVTQAITETNRLMREDPTRRAFFNLLPPNAQGNPNTGAVIQAAIHNGMPVVSYDNYVLNADGSDRTQEYFNNLETIRTASLRHKVPFWAFALSLKHWGYRRPSESDLRWNQYMNLAYGAKGLWYFCYWGPSNWDSKWDNKAIVNPATGAKTDIFDCVKAINRSVGAMGDVLLGLTHEDVVHTAPPAGHRTFRPGQYWISGLAARNAAIGFFHDAAGAPYAMVVNQLHGMNQSAKATADMIELTFAPSVTAVTAVNWLDGQPGKLTLKDHKATLPVQGGTGVLLKALIQQP